MDINTILTLLVSWLWGISAMIIWIIGLLSLKKFAFKKITEIAKRTKSNLDDILLSALSFPVTLIIIVTGLLIFERISPLSSEVDRTVDIILAATFVIAFMIFADKVLRNLISNYQSKVEFLQTSRGIIQGFIRGLIIGIGLLILLDTFGISITPLLASLGVGSLAVALALQDTLANFFSGIYLVMDKPILVGQFIRLDSGEEGYVVKIGWRSTHIRMIPNNIVIVPNSRLSNSIITNYYMPEQMLSVLVQVGVHYDSDLSHVERVTIEVAKDLMKNNKGGVPGFEPFIRYHTFGDSSINFTVILRAKEFMDHYLIKHEFIKALHKRYKEEGIVIPFPIRTLDFNPEQIEFLKK